MEERTLNQPQAEKPSILVVDDNPLILNVLEGLFRAENYDVHVSANGEEALEVLDKEPVDVIICDVMMPQMDGFQLHEMVRKKQELSHIPFVFLTALGNDEAKARGYELGADGYLVKPFQPQGLLSIVRGKILRSRSIRSSNKGQYDKYRKKVIHTLSHEFRTPLVAINTGAELLLDQGNAIELDQSNSLLKSIQRGGRRLERLVGDFMLMQQLEAGIAEQLFEQRAVVRAARDIVKMYVSTQGSMIHGEGFELNVIDNSDGAEVRIYEPHVHDILARLVSNAMKFSGDERIVDIETLIQGENVVFEVRDRGMGFDVKKAEEALALFGQIDRERLEQQGSGFGLAIAQRYALVNGGDLTFTNREGGGATVRLVLPRYTSD